MMTMMIRRNLGSVCAKFGRGTRSYSTKRSGQSKDRAFSTISSSLVEAAAGLPEKGLMVCKWLGTGSAGYGGYKASEYFFPIDNEEFRENLEDWESTLQSWEKLKNYLEGMHKGPVGNQTRTH
ncbi:hypothetical protein ISN44_As04g033730 [Arabidopsis suecica]|uniref:Uncharacterized protein n=1 Tax=Arabidopsis suecica TaxID=45249 RepID=A0A8T2EEY8_ARASU|nr:hypothetical protein ISN44_As04g033730 [Arabidopsis suecica]